MSATKLTISLTTADLATAGSYPVVVTNPAPGGGTSVAMNFIVANGQTPAEWAWMSGANTAYQAGVYGTQGVSSSANVPGAREAAVSWTDKSGNLWLFGGDNYVYVFNDLWTFNSTSNAWTWVSGADTGDQSGVYGTQGIAASANVPGARDSAVSWIDKSGNLWLFGGLGSDSTGDIGDLNDLWEFSPTSSTWTWVSGANTAGSQGVYGTMGVPSIANVPGARYLANTWTDKNGNLWLFGGVGHDLSVSGQGGGGTVLNDLWEFNPTSKAWTWIGGTSGGGSELANYGYRGVTAATNIPGARYMAISWTDNGGNLWLFGGLGNDSTNYGVDLNDLWEFNPTSEMWTWISGANAGNQPGVYGTQDVPSPANIPGARELAVSWIDASGNLWLFGGYGLDSKGSQGALSDLWEFNPTNQAWTWISGPDIMNQAAVYGTMGVPASTNQPGGRSPAASWTDNVGNFWLFGGNGSSSYSGYGEYLNDLWRYQPSTTPVPAITSVSVVCSPVSILTNQTSICAQTVIGSGSFSTSVNWSVSPTSIGSVSGAGVFMPASVGTATITATSTEDATKSGSAAVAVAASASGISVSPSSVTVPAGAVQTFTATVPEGGGATWSIQEGAPGGTITSVGIYTAPGTTGTYHVVATNSANSAQTATATVNVIATVLYLPLYSFPSAFESASLIQGTDGSFYGTNEMIAYKIGESGTFTQLAQLSSSPSAPISSLIQVSNGNFYGVNSEGNGSIFMMDTSGNVTPIYSFPNQSSGTTSGLWPWAGLIQGEDGNFYGTTYAGGNVACTPYGWGVPAYGPFDYNPRAGYGCGTVFKMDSSGNVTILYSFSGQSDGDFPQAALIQGSDGNFYGTTSGGGTYGYGSVFKLSASGSLQVLHSFSGTDGNGPVATLLRSTDGYLYGTTSSTDSNGSGGGEVFKVDTSGNNFTILHTFSGSDGWFPVAPLIQGSDGSFYGTTWAGGDETCGSYYSDPGSNYPYPRAGGCGAVFKMDTYGNVTVFHTFEEPQTGDGNDPYAGLLLGKDGYLYGTTYYGGTSIYFGTVFRLALPDN
jgi:uncharacterized repeat protein (TIGR03803 family)